MHMITKWTLLLPAAAVPGTIWTRIYVLLPVLLAYSLLSFSLHFNSYSCFMSRLTIESTVDLHTGRKIPRLGFGSGNLRDQIGVDAVEHAIETGYLMGEPP